MSLSAGPADGNPQGSFLILNHKRREVLVLSLDSVLSEADSHAPNRSGATVRRFG
jgi:hypothetical protein